MAEIIEFCGSPGSGKSTIYRKMISAWKSSLHWAPGDSLFPIDILSMKSFYYLSKNILNRGNKRATPHEMRLAGSRFIHQYPEYIDACWQHISMREKKSFNSSDQRFEKAVHIFKLIQKTQICLECKTKNTIVLEEGLINGVANALYWSDNSSQEKEEISDLFQHIPLPHGVIHLNLSKKDVVDRLLRRKRYIPSFEGLEEKKLIDVIQHFSKIKETAVTILKELGVPVLHLNSSEMVSINSVKALRFVDELSRQ